MNAWLVALVYAATTAAAVALLYRFRSAAWYWHALALAAAMGIGLAPPPSNWRGPAVDVAFGVAFLLLFVWGIGAFTFVPPEKRPPAHR